MPQEPLALVDWMEPQDHKDPQVPQVPLVFRAKLVQLVLVDSLDQQVPLELRD